jgi:hypothetical protein
MTIKARVQYDGMNDDFSFWLIRIDDYGRRYRAKFEWEEYNPDTAPVEPTMRAQWSAPSNQDVLQTIVNAAYEAGIRPNADLKGETAALKGHLSDMRALAFGSLKIEPPK